MDALLPLVLLGIGMGITGAPSQAAALSAVSRSQAGMASGALSTMRYLGGVVGASLGGAVLAAGVTGDGMSLGFALLAGVSIAVALASFGLPHGPASRPAEPARV